VINRIKKNHVRILLTCIVWYCSYLLLYKLWVQSFWIDEWYSTYVAKNMTLDWLYKSKYFLFEWLQVLFFKLWWFTDFWARFPSVVTHIWSILLMYFIPCKLCKNKYVWLVSALIFWLLYWEIGRWRDARFYSLLQFLFLGWITLVIKRVETKKNFYLNSTIILTCLWVIFHPFLYSIWAILLWVFILQYKKIWDFNSLFSKKFLSTRVLVVILWICAIIYGTLWWVLNWSLTSWLARKTKKNYFNFYNSHLWSNLWIIYIIWLLWMVHFFVRKSFKEVMLFFVPLVLFAYALVIKGYLMHSRYALLIYPLIVLSACIFIYDVINLIKNKYAKISILVLILTSAICTTNLQFLPSEYYYFDYTSPQPDFKWAYESIPSWQKVISGFPTMCDWYYSDRWTCTNAIRVDLVHDWKTENLLNRTGEKYTKTPYIDILDDIPDWTYYFVIDNLTQKSSNINKKLYDQIYQYWIPTFRSWNWYNNIVVIKIQ